GVTGAAGSESAVSFWNDSDTAATLTGRCMYDHMRDHCGRLYNLLTPGGVRRFTPKECERLQGFPDSWTAIGWRGRSAAPDELRWCALGNAMAVPVVQWVLGRIEAFEMQRRAAAASEA